VTARLLAPHAAGLVAAESRRAQPHVLAHLARMITTGAAGSGTATNPDAASEAASTLLRALLQRAPGLAEQPELQGLSLGPADEASIVRQARNREKRQRRKARAQSSRAAAAEQEAAAGGDAEVSSSGGHDSQQHLVRPEGAQQHAYQQQQRQPAPAAPTSAPSALAAPWMRLPHMQGQAAFAGIRGSASWHGGPAAAGGCAAPAASAASAAAMAVGPQSHRVEEGSSAPRQAAASAGAGGSGGRGAQQPESSSLCVVCWDAPLQVGLFHQGTQHVCVCQACSELLAAGQPCPMCRQPVEAKARFYVHGV
jgi:hypothetical protein